MICKEIYYIRLSNIILPNNEIYFFKGDILTKLSPMLLYPENAKPLNILLITSPKMDMILMRLKSVAI